MFRVQATSFQNPDIKYGNTKIKMDGDAQWNLDGKNFLSTNSDNGNLVGIPYVVMYDGRVTTQRINEITKNFEKQLSERAVGKVRRLDVQHADLRSGAYENPLRWGLRKAVGLKAKLVGHTCAAKQGPRHLLDLQVSRR